MHGLAFFLYQGGTCGRVDILNFKLYKSRKNDKEKCRKKNDKEKCRKLVDMTPSGILLLSCQARANDV